MASLSAEVCARMLDLHAATLPRLNRLKITKNKANVDFQLSPAGSPRVISAAPASFNVSEVSNLSRDQHRNGFNCGASAAALPSASDTGRRSDEFNSRSSLCSLQSGSSLSASGSAFSPCSPAFSSGACAPEQPTFRGLLSLLRRAASSTSSDVSMQSPRGSETVHYRVGADCSQDSCISESPVGYPGVQKVSVTCTASHAFRFSNTKRPASPGATTPSMLRSFKQNRTAAFSTAFDG